jgi:hypothetical protein
VFLKGMKLGKLDWVTKKVVARHMTRGTTDVESSVKDCLKQRPMSRNLELGCRFQHHSLVGLCRMLAILNLHHVLIYLKGTTCFRRRDWSRRNLLTCVPLDVNDSIFSHIDI